MPLLTKFYPAREQALDTVKDLKQRGLRDKAVHLMGAPGHWSETGLRSIGIRRESAQAYAVRLRAGQTLLIVDAPVAGAALAQEIMDRPRGRQAAPSAVEREAAPQTVPGPSKPHHEGEEWKSRYEGTGWEEATPLSSALGLPLLLHKAAPFSSSLGLPTLSGGKASNRKPLLNNFFPSKIFGPLLTKSQEPTGFALLIKSGEPLTPFTLAKQGGPITPFTLIKGGKPIGFGLPLLIGDKPRNGL